MLTMDEGPFSLNRYTVSYPRWRLAFEWITQALPPKAKILDVGCFTGEFVRFLAQEGYFAFGIDINRAAIGYASRVRAAGAYFFWYKGDRFPFENQTFDGVTLLDVVEHVAREDVIIGEVSRVLKKNGIVICSVPNQGRYASLDPENFKFKFPQAHRRLYTLLGQGEVYLSKYNRDPLLFGYFARNDAQRLYHRHYSLARLQSLWGADFLTLRMHRGGGLPFVLGYLGNKICFRLFRRYFRPFSRIMTNDFVRDYAGKAYNLQLLFKKIQRC